MSEDGSTVIGSWEVAIDTPMGAQTILLEFVDEHTATARHGSDSLPLQNVSVSGNAASCAVKLTRPMSITVKCAVAVDGDSMTGTASAGFFGKFALTGRRT
jgi:hypothetical protein